MMAFSCVDGLGIASMFSAAMTTAQEYVQVSGRAAAILVCGSSLGKSSLPLLVVYSYSNFGQRAFPATMCAIVALEGLAICALLSVGRKVSTQFRSIESP